MITYKVKYKKFQLLFYKKFNFFFIRLNGQKSIWIKIKINNKLFY